MEPLNQDQLNGDQFNQNSQNSTSSSSNRTLLLAVIISSLTFLGIIACINLIINSSSQSAQISQIQTSQQPYNNLSGQLHVDGKIKDDKKTPVMVTQDSFIKATSTSVVTKVISSQNISGSQDVLTARAYLVGNLKTGKIYLSLNTDKVLPVASVSKLMTAIVAMGRFAPTTTIEIIPADMNVATDTSAIGVGEKFTLKDILYPLLLNSSNIAAEAIASTNLSTSTNTSTSSASTSRLAFLDNMFSTAQEIGMLHTSFTDPSGLDSNDQASAKDVFTLAKYLYSLRPDILAITRTAHYAVATTTDHGAHIFGSIHPFINDTRFIGGKTGRTVAAGETMLTMLNIDGKPIAFIILHSDLGQRAADTNLLIKKYLSLAL